MNHLLITLTIILLLGEATYIYNAWRWRQGSVRVVEMGWWGVMAALLIWNLIYLSRL